MAVSNLPQLSGGALFTDTANANAAIVVKASSCVLYEMELDNTANAAATYCKLYNNGAPTVGTTAPDEIHYVPANTKITKVIPGGLTFATALAVSSLTAGGTAGTTSPTSSFAVKMVYV